MNAPATDAAALANPPADDFSQWVKHTAARAEQVLNDFLPTETQVPTKLHQAMRYTTLGGGKRVRPLLAYAAGAVTNAPQASLNVAAAAVELIHVYSLVHDDMPCMDDDDMRRGKPTVHKAYDEATALLVGDALQTRAFELLAIHGTVPAPVRLRLVQLLANASGSAGMAGGQAIDLDSVGKKLNRAQLEHMHRLKTGALLRAAVLMGAVCGAPDGQLAPATEKALDHYAQIVGLAFQVVDDILDVQADSATLGKTAGKDAANDKPTYVSLLGLSQAQELAAQLRIGAHQALDTLGPSVDTLRLGQLADFVVLRSH